MVCGSCWHQCGAALWHNEALVLVWLVREILDAILPFHFLFWEVCLCDGALMEMSLSRHHLRGASKTENIMCFPPPYSLGMACSLLVWNLSTTQNSSTFTQKPGFSQKKYMLIHRSYSRRLPLLVIILERAPLHSVARGRTAILLHSCWSTQCPSLILLVGAPS